MGRYEKITYDMFAGRFLAMYQIIYIANISLAQVKGLNELSNIFPIGMALFFLIYMLYRREMLTRCWNSIMLFGLAFGLLYFGGAVYYQNFSSDFFSHVYWSLLYCIPLGCVWYRVDRFDIAIRQTEKACLISTFCGLLVCIMGHVGLSDIGHTDYNMSLGYSLLFPALFYMNYFKGKVNYLGLAITNIGVIIFAGSRGPILCLVVYLLVSLFTKKGIKSKLGIVSLGLVFVLNYSTIMEWIVNTLVKHGIYSRTLSYLTYRTFYSGREEVWAEAINRIAEKAFTGWGIGYNNTAMLGLVPHNILLEFLISYGVILGTVISMVVIVLIWKRVFVPAMKKHVYADVGVILFSIGFVPLMISFTYLTWVYFWILLAFCFNRRRAGRRNTIMQR